MCVTCISRALQRYRKASYDDTALFARGRAGVARAFRRRHTLCDTILYEQLPGAVYGSNRAMRVIKLADDRCACVLEELYKMAAC